MAIKVSLGVLVLLLCLVATCYGNISFSSLQRTLTVTASPKSGQGNVFVFRQVFSLHVSKKPVSLSHAGDALPRSSAVLKAWEDNITVTWSFNATSPAGIDSSYKMVKVKLCYAPISQQDRAWRKTEDHLSKDKTCQHKIVTKPYSRSNNNFTWMVQKDVPSATYFIRAYIHDSADHEIAYGQTTDSQKTTNLFEIQAISGRHVSLDITSVCFSAFAVVSLFGFFFMEKRKAKSLQKN